MKIVSSAIPPAPRGSGRHSVPAVTNPSRQAFDSRSHRSAASGPEPTAGSEPGRVEAEPYIDAEFVEILREAAWTAKTVNPADETLRRALEAYRTGGFLNIPIGSIVDEAA